MASMSTVCSLSQCLSNNSLVMNGEKLGNKYGNYLIYKDGSGWEVKHLNLFQKVLRHIFGFYSQTHSSSLKNKIQEYQEEAAQIKILRDKFLPVVPLVAVVSRGSFDALGVNTYKAYEDADEKQRKAENRKLGVEYKGNPHFRPGVFN